MTDASFHVVLYERADAERLLEDDQFRTRWAALYRACPWASEFQRPDFLSAWFQVFRERYTGLALCAESEEGRLGGLLWLAYDRREHRYVVAGHAQAEYHGFLALPEIANAFMAAALDLYFARTDSTRLEFTYVLPDLPLAWAEDGGPYAKRAVATPALRPMIELTKLAEVRRRLERHNKNRFNKIARLRQSGQLVVKELRSLEEFNAYSGAIAALYDQRIVERKGGVDSFVQNPNYMRFFGALLALQQGLLHVLVAVLDGKLIAAKVLMRYRNCLLPVCSPFDESAAKLSPMKMMMLLAAEKARALGLSYFDLTPSGDWKLEFATLLETATTLAIHPHQAAALAERTALQAKALIKHSLERVGIDHTRVKTLLSGAWRARP